jgi:methionyl-tRNA synthetase
VEFLTRHENFIFPAYRQKQVLEFLKEPLNDLCISRPRERLEWGIPLPFDDGYVTYVWFDALLNYYSAVADLPGTWPATWHVIGKDILVPPHAVYWPIMLKAAGLPLPQGIIAHGWWMTRGAKMSKSTGNALNPLDLVDEFGADAFRYFLIREMNVGQDSDFTREQFLVRYNSELANNLGNLVNRTLNMTTRFAGGVVPAAEAGEPAERELQALWNATREEVLPLCEGFQFHTALERTMSFVTATNAYIERRAPWKLGKSVEAKDAALLRTSLATMAEALRLAVALLQSVTPSTTAKINAVLGYEPGPVWRDELNWGARLAGPQGGRGPCAVSAPRSGGQGAGQVVKILPIHPAQNASPAALQAFLAQCREAASQDGRPKLVSISLAVDALDPLAVLESIFDPAQPHFYTERPGIETAIAGAEVAVEHVAHGPGRFASVQRFVDEDPGAHGRRG